MFESESESEPSLVSYVSIICDGEPPAGCDDVAAYAGLSCEDPPAWDKPLACGIGTDTACDNVTAIDEALPCGAGDLKKNARFTWKKLR